MQGGKFSDLIFSREIFITILMRGGKFSDLKFSGKFSSLFCCEAENFPI
jgi:hypothetical protein